MTPRRQGCSGPRRSSRSRDIGTWVPGIATALVMDIPRTAQYQGSPASSDRGPGHTKAPSGQAAIGNSVPSISSTPWSLALMGPLPPRVPMPSTRQAFECRMVPGRPGSRGAWGTRNPVVDGRSTGLIPRRSRRPGSREDPWYHIVRRRTGNPRVPRSLRYLGSTHRLDIKAAPVTKMSGFMGRSVPRCANPRRTGWPIGYGPGPTGLVPSRPDPPSDLGIPGASAHRRHRYQGIKAPMKPGPSMPVSRGEQAAKADDRPWSLATRLPEPLA